MRISKDRKMKKSKLILNWILRILLSIGFLLASLGKLTSNISVLDMFENWGYPDWFHLFIGAIELIMAILILIPKTLKFAILGITIILIGAIITHLVNDPILEIIRPIIFFILLSGVYYINFHKKD